MEIKIRVPRIPAGALANVVGLLGLVAIAVAVGALAGSFWWTALAGGIFAVALSYVAQTHAEAERATEGPRRPAVVAEASRMSRTG